MINLRLPPSMNVEKGMRMVGKLDAGYWSGLINYQRAKDHAADRRNNYKAAITWFDKQTLQAFPNNPWTNGAQYNLARTYEALGDTQQATLRYESNTTPRPATTATCSGQNGSRRSGRIKRARASKRFALIPNAANDLRRRQRAGGNQPLSSGVDREIQTSQRPRSEEQQVAPLGENNLVDRKLPGHPQNGEAHAASDYLAIGQDDLMSLFPLHAICSSLAVGSQLYGCPHRRATAECQQTNRLPSKGWISTRRT